jgi:hypothetical protein
VRAHVAELDARLERHGLLLAKGLDKAGIRRRDELLALLRAALVPA